MANKAVFLDRDNTLIEDPGFLTDPDSVRLLPGVELAVKTFMQAGYLVVVVTNQSGVARGLLTEETLNKIHDRLLEMMASKGARIDEVYYCPFHPDGSVEEYAVESDLRKPKPGMLVQAAEDMDIDLSESWMVGDRSRDVEAGQRAGCRTIRVRKPHETMPGEADQEGVQADFTVRNLVEAARVILRQGGPRHPRMGGGVERAARGQAAAESQYVDPIYAAEEDVPDDAADDELIDEPADEPPETPAVTATSPEHQPQERDMDSQYSSDILDTPAQADAGSPDSVRREILQHVRQMARQDQAEEFSVTKLIAGIIQMLALLALTLTFVKILRPVDNSMAEAQVWATVAGVLQVMALTFFVMQRGR